MNEEIRSKNENIAKDIVRAINSVKFGYIQVTIQDSKVVQIDKTEKFRVTAKDREGNV